jgi:hypothetical protein
MDDDEHIDRRIADWTTAGLLTRDQADAIHAWEAARGAVSNPTHAPAVIVDAGVEPMRDRIAGTFGVLGGVLVGLGVLLTVAANWDDLGDATRVTTIVAVMTAANLIGLWADARGAVRWAGTTAYVVGTLVFAGGIFALGQVYNVHAHTPAGFLVIATVASVIAVFSARSAVGWIAGAAWLGWIGYELVDALDSVDDALAVVGAGVLIGVAAIAVGWTLDGLAQRAADRAVDDGPRPLAADLDTIGGALRHLGLFGTLALLVPTSFAWHGIDELDQGAGAPFTIGAAIVVLAIVAWMSRVATLRLRRQAAIALSAASGLVVLVSFVPSGIVVGVAANLLIAGGGIGLAWLGLAEDRRDSYAWGIVWIITLIVVRYLDALFMFELGGLGFIGVGLLLIGCGWLVGRSRKYWIGRETT